MEKVTKFMRIPQNENKKHFRDVQGSEKII
jgi:hypothetical protein